MKSLPRLLLLILITSLPFLSTAQLSVGVLTAPISSVTTTKILVPIGVELKFSPTTSIILEYGIPVFDIKTDEYNERAASFGAEFRNYKPTVDKKGFQRYYAINFKHSPESYALENNSYFTKNEQEILFDYAEVNTTTNSISIKLGMQKVLKNKIILDFNLGFAFNNKVVSYKNVTLPPPPPPNTYYTSAWANGIGGWGFDNLTSYDFIPAFSPQPDNTAIGHTYISLPMSIRVGYLFSR